MREHDYAEAVNRPQAIIDGRSGRRSWHGVLRRFLLASLVGCSWLDWQPEGGLRIQNICLRPLIGLMSLEARRQAVGIFGLGGGSCPGLPEAKNQ